MHQGQSNGGADGADGGGEEKRKGDGAPVKQIPAKNFVVVEYPGYVGSRDDKRKENTPQGT